VSALRGAFRMVVVGALLAWAAGLARAGAVAYTLSAGAEFRTGCFAVPCICGAVQYAMGGDFALVQQPSDPQFAHFDVVGVNWMVQFPQGFVPITGTGTYRVGGTGVVRQQLSLDLSVGGAPVRHFDSGLVAGGDNFPRIEVDISLYGETPCIDTMLRVRAGPGGTTGVGAAGASLGALVPNPFQGVTRLPFSLREAGPVRVHVLDAAGRCVRTLVDAAWMASGTQAVVWDGRRDDGRACAAGCYFICVRSAGRTERTSVVKLH
jgi:hypothetical protein